MASFLMISMGSERRSNMFNPSKGRPAAMFNRDFDFTNPLDRVMSQPHEHEFGIGYDLQYKDMSGKVQARLDGLRPDEAAFLRKKHDIY